MRNIIDIVTIASIILTYNLLSHNFASYSYKTLPYDDKVKKSAIMLFVFGIIAYVLAKFILDDDKNKLRNSVLSCGLKISGIILILTSVYSNWNNFKEEMKMFLIFVTFVGVVCYTYKN